MTSHTKKQAIILKTMGVDVWKLRRPSESLETAEPENALTSSQSGIDLPNPVVRVPTDQISVSGSHVLDANANVADVAGSGTFEPNLNLNSGDQSVPEIIDWRALVNCQAGAKWCFVCAHSKEDFSTETKLFDAIAFALGLSESDYHVIQAFAMLEEGSESGAMCGIKKGLSSLIEEESPSRIVVFGEGLAQFLIDTDKPLDILRSENYRYQGGKSSLVVTYDLNHLLAQPFDKLFVWQDLVKAKNTSS